MTGLFQQQLGPHNKRVKQQMQQRKQGMKAASDQSGMQLGNQQAVPMGVADRVSQIASPDSALNKRQRMLGEKTAGRRGLLHSTMAIQAGEAAVLDKAIPMAQTDAQLENSRYMQAQDFGQRDKEQDRNLGLEERKFDESRRQFDQGFGLEKDRFGEQQRQFDQGFGLEKDRFGLQRDQFGEQQRQFNQGFGLDQQRFQEQQRQFDQGLSLDQQRFDEDTRRFNEGMGLDRDRFELQQGQADNQQTNTQMQAFQNIESNYATLVNQINANTDLPREAREQQLQHAADIRNSNIALMQQMYPTLAELQWGEVEEPFVQREEEQEEEQAEQDAIADLPINSNEPGDPRRDDPDWRWMPPRKGQGGRWVRA
jgi:hypothetical protein